MQEEYATKLTIETLRGYVLMVNKNTTLDFFAFTTARRRLFLKKIGFVVLLSIGVCTQLSAAPVHVGFIQLSGGVTSGGLQQLQLFNMTDVNCDAVTYTVCDAINFTDWALNVTYTQGGVAQAPVVFTGANPTDNIGPYNLLSGPYTGSSGAQWTFDQSCSSLIGCPPDDFDTVITAVTFTANVSSTTLHLFDPGTGAPIFFSQPSFTLTGWAPTNPFSDSIDLILDEAAPVVTGGDGGVPEPSSLSFFLIGAAALGMGRIRRRAISKQ